MVTDRGWGSKFFDIANYALLTLLAIICLLPLIHVLAVSLSNRAASSGGFVTVWPIGFTLANYKRVFEAGTVYRAGIISIQRTVLGTTLNLALTVLTAYPLSKSPAAFRGRTAFMFFFLFAMLFGGGLIPWFLVIRSLGLLNTIWALVLPGAVPIWNVILMMNFFRDVPKELEEAAVIDGADHFRILWRIYLPISVPALATMTLFSAVTHWNSWFDGMILMTKNTLYPLQTFLRTVVVELDMTVLSLDPTVLYELSDRSARAATIFVSTVPILIVYPFLQRYFISGIRLGAVKG